MDDKLGAFYIVERQEHEKGIRDRFGNVGGVRKNQRK